MKVLITGIGGMVASHLADLLLENGEEVYGTYRWTEDLSNIEHIKDKIHLVPMDLNDAWSCLKVIEDIRPDAISHLAAQSYVSDSFIYPAETIRTNTLGTLNLLEACRIVRDKDSTAYDLSNGTPLKYYFNPVIHVCSSSEVYGLVEEKDIPIKETQPFNPSNPYAVGKVGEDMLALLYFTNYGLKTIRTRMFTHTGPRRKMLSAEVNFAKQIAEIEKEYKKSKAEAGDNYFGAAYELQHGNLDSVRTWADARDAVKAYYMILKRGIGIGKVYNIGGNTTKTVGEMLHYMLSISNCKEVIVPKLSQKLLRPYDVTLQIPDCSAFKEDYPEWQPLYTFEETISSVLDAWRLRV